MIKEWVELISALEQEKIWPEATVEEREILVGLMLLANTEERQWEYCGKLFTIRSGQLVISYNSLVQRFGKDIPVAKQQTKGLPNFLIIRRPFSAHFLSIKISQPSYGL